MYRYEQLDDISNVELFLSHTSHICTHHSMSDAYDRNRAAQRNAIDLDFSFDVYYHTAVSDPRCMVGSSILRAEQGLAVIFQTDIGGRIVSEFHVIYAAFYYSLLF